MSEYDGRQFVGVDLHWRRSVIVRQFETGEHLSAVWIVNEPAELLAEIGKAGCRPEVVLEATYGWVLLGGGRVGGCGRVGAFGASVGD